ncbi:FadR/GntR family transcriptional regulator [Celeribacter sp.]|uniref:FadR/GntR family transcriptional regulator n=1 Tax=Celeribacter sp. TaxID=1890673 RepID=UPI003A8C94CE
MTVYRRPDPIPVQTGTSREFGERDRDDGFLLEKSPKGLSERAAERILQAILEGVWGSDGYLPKETELEVRLGVSRTAVREAIKILATLSVVAPKRRRGTEVLPRPMWKIVDREMIGWMNGAKVSSVSYLEQFEAMIGMLESVVRSLARQRADLSPWIERDLAENSLYSDPTTLVLSSFRQLADCLGNQFVSSFVFNLTWALQDHHFEELAQNFDEMCLEKLSTMAVLIANGNERAAVEQFRECVAGYLTSTNTPSLIIPSVP